jgi:hypothetical protein
MKVGSRFLLATILVIYGFMEYLRTGNSITIVLTIALLALLIVVSRKVDVHGRKVLD